MVTMMEVQEGWKKAAEKSFETSKTMVEEPAKLAAKAAGEAVHKTAEKVMERVLQRWF